MDIIEQSSITGSDTITSVYDLKPRFQAVLRPIVGTLARAGATANQVTLMGVFVSLAGGAAIWITDAHAAALAFLPIVLFVRMALNAIDGMLAREHDQISTEGMFLNELADVASDAVLYMPLVCSAFVSPVLAGLVVAGGAMTEMAGVMGLLVGADRRYDGPFGKSDRAVFWGALAVLLALGLGGAWVTGVLIVACVLCVWTTVRRCRAAIGQAGAATK